MFDCMPDQPNSTMSTTLQPTWDEFRRLIAEFLKAADTATLEELEAGAKCCGLAYLGIQWDDNNPLHTVHRNAGAPALMRLVTKKCIEREMALELPASVAQPEPFTVPREWLAPCDHAIQPGTINPFECAKCGRQFSAAAPGDQLYRDRT